MKNSILKFIVLSIITTFAFSSCSDYLDKQPDDQLDLEAVFENKMNKEIAENLGITVKGVEYHISRALKEFRISLKDYLPLFYFFFYFH